jgi:hypothetical protein
MDRLSVEIGKRRFSKADAQTGTIEFASAYALKV